MNLEIFQIIRLADKQNYDKVIGKCDIGLTNELGQSLLHEAVASGSIEIGKDLIDRQADINQKDRRGQTALHYAAVHYQVELARYIVHNGGDVNIPDIHGNNALWTAVFNSRGKYDLVRLYKEAGGDPGHKNNSGKSPIDFANQINDSSLIEILT